MNMALWIIIVLGALGLMALSSRILIEKAWSFGEKMHVSPFLLGLIPLSLAAALPEAMLLVSAKSLNASTLVPATLVGANLANILILGAIAAFHTLNVGRAPIFLSMSAITVIFAADGRISAPEAILMILACTALLKACMIKAAVPNFPNLPTLANVLSIFKEKRVYSSILWILAMGLGAYLSIKGILEISSMSKLNAETLALSVIAIALSFSEILIALRAIKANSPTIFYGNMLGSFMINLGILLPLSALFKETPLGMQTLSLALPFLGVATLIFIVFCLSEKHGKAIGAFYGILYAAFLGQVFRII